MGNMRCRAIHTEDNKKTVVWFGSIGRNIDGTARFVNKDKSSFDIEQKAVASSLTERLSVIRGELWYAMSYGLPLFEKNRSKIEFDSFILSTIKQHPDVISVDSFTSEVKNRQYRCSVKISSRYGQISITM